MTNIDLTPDQGRAFGEWQDKTSLFMYHTSLAQIIEAARIPPGATIADYGGANGILKRYLPKNRVTTIDYDASKAPDVTADILEHRDPYDIGFCRYVLHYLSDKDVIRFIRGANVRELVIVQFANDASSLCTKYDNSQGEGTKHFRTVQQLLALIPLPFEIIAEQDYYVTSEFYENRLGIVGAKPHRETLIAARIRK